MEFSPHLCVRGVQIPADDAEYDREEIDDVQYIEIQSNENLSLRDGMHATLIGTPFEPAAGFTAGSFALRDVVLSQRGGVPPNLFAVPSAPPVAPVTVASPVAPPAPVTTSVPRQAATVAEPLPVAASPAAPIRGPAPRRTPAATSPSPRPDQHEVTSNGPGAGPWIVGGIGVASLGAAEVSWWVIRAGALTDLNAACHPSTMTCDPSAQGAMNRGQTASVVTDLAVGVGAAGLAAGLLWGLLGQGTESGTAHRTASLGVEVMPSRAGGIVGIQGSF